MATSRGVNCPTCQPDAVARGYRTYWTMEADYNDEGECKWVWECTNCGHKDPMVSRKVKAGGKAQLRAIKELEELERDTAEVTDLGYGNVFVQFPHWFQKSYTVGPRGRVEKH